MLTYYERNRDERLAYQKQYNKTLDKKEVRNYNVEYYHRKRKFNLEYNKFVMESRKKKKVSESKTTEEIKEVELVISYYEDPSDSPFIPFKIPR